MKNNKHKHDANCKDQPIQDSRHEWQMVFMEMNNKEDEEILCLKCYLRTSRSLLENANKIQK